MGNSIGAETGASRVLSRGLATLREAFPRDWGIEVTGPADRDHNALLLVRTPVGASARFVVEVKSMTRGSARKAVQAAETASIRAALPAVVFTDFANPALRDACVDRGVGFVDGTGWVSLRNDVDP